jgi:hypothetical protein
MTKLYPRSVLKIIEDRNIPALTAVFTVNTVVARFYDVQLTRFRLLVLTKQLKKGMLGWHRSNDEVFVQADLLTLNFGVLLCR